MAKGKIFSKQGSTSKELQVRLQTSQLLRTSVIKKLQTGIQIPSCIELTLISMSCPPLIKKSITNCNSKICTIMSLLSTMMNLKSKRANLKKVLLESQIKFLKTQNNEMILNFQEAMKSKCSSQSCRLCKCTSSITKWVKTMNIGIVTLVL